MEPTLTDDNVRIALSVQGTEHPVLSLFGEYSPRLGQFSKNYHMVEENRSRQDYARKNFGFFADLLEETDPFTLAPLEIIAIWARLTDFELPRYESARMLAFRYATEYVDGALGSSGRYNFETGGFPPEACITPDQIEAMGKRVEDVRLSVDNIQEYIDGLPDAVREIVRLTRTGDTQKVAELIRLIEDRKNIPHINSLEKLQISENFGNGILELRMSMSEAVRHLF